MIALLLLVSCNYNRFEPLADQPYEPWAINYELRNLREGDIRDSRVVQGVVVTSDSTGNFYKEFLLQDLHTSAVISIRVGLYDLYALYPVGAVVAVRLEGLSLRYVDNLLAVPLPSSLSMISTRLHHQRQTAPIRLLTLDNLSDLARLEAGTLVEIRGIYFPEAQGGTYAGEVVVRQVSSTAHCMLYTSPYASFAGEALPEGVVTIRAVVIYHNDRLQLKLLR